MRIAGKHVKGAREGVSAPTASDVLYYDSVTEQWITISVYDLPISVVGITATTLGTALLELLDAITP